MEKFKNALKSMNIFGLLAITLIAFVTMAFTPSKKNTVAQKYGYDQTIPLNQNRWVLIEGKTMDNSGSPAPGSYRCDASSDICSGLFTTPPTSSSATPDVGTELPGEFSLN